MPVNQSSIRTELALSAYSLVGQVGYFWGGKSTALGWDPLWGTVMQVTIDGSQSTGTFRSYGLDCSGFVGWVYVNAFQDPSILGSLGSVTSEQTGATPWSATLYSAGFLPPPSRTMLVLS